MKHGLTHYKPIAEAISMLLYPHAEIVLHDLRTKRIWGIFNNFSKRKIGDESLLHDVESLSVLPDVFPVYFKTNWDGRRLKSVTATLKNDKGSPIGLLCINLDVSQWEQMSHFLLQWCQGIENGTKPKILFKDDWRERINTYVSDYLKKKNTSLKDLDKEKKRSLVNALHREGAFSAKNAANYIADVLDISRATLYNYLKEE